jgi:hypothetical protein
MIQIVDAGLEVRVDDAQRGVRSYFLGTLLRRAKPRCGGMAGGSLIYSSGSTDGQL